MTQRIVYPFGWLAGKEGEVTDVIESLAIEMLGHRSNLRDRAERLHGPDLDRARETLEARAEDLEKYAVILNVLFIQLKPEVWNPHAQAGLLELAEKHGVTLPEWMKGSPTA